MVPPRTSIARLAMTSLAFMFDWVPLPVWKTTRGSRRHAPRRRPRGRRAAPLPRGPRRGRRAQLRVGLHRRQLEQAEGADHRATPTKVSPADREVLDAALRLRAPVVLRRNLDRSHAVGLGACRAHLVSVSRSATARWWPMTAGWPLSGSRRWRRRCRRWPTPGSRGRAGRRHRRPRAEDVDARDAALVPAEPVEEEKRVGALGHAVEGQCRRPWAEGHPGHVPFAAGLVDIVQFAVADDRGTPRMTGSTPVTSPKRSSIASP